MGFFLNSCLDSGDQSLSGQGQLFYISQSEGLQVAYNGNLAMTSDLIRTKQPNRWYLITWSWNAEYGMASENVYNATTSQIEDIPMGAFLQQNAPDISTINAPIAAIEMVKGVPVANVFGNNLIFVYGWDKSEGESVRFRLYSPLSTPINTADPVVIDVRLERFGTPSGTAKRVDDIVSVNMAALKNAVTFNSGETFKDINLRFRYNTGTETSIIPVRVYKD